MTPTPPFPRLVLHIGQHKTGSKALQAFLAHNREILRNRGVLYPLEEHPDHDIPAYARSQFRFFALVRRAALTAVRGQVAADAYWQTVAPYCRPFVDARDYLDAVERERRRIGARCVVLSAEDLFDMHTAHEEDFSLALLEAGVEVLEELLSEFGPSVRAVVYLRRQDHLLAAHYAQFIKGSSTRDVDLEPFAVRFAPRLDARRLLDCWGTAFGRHRIVVRPYERQSLPPDGVVADFFQHGLGTPIPEGTAAPPVDVESTNVSPGRDLIEYLRLLNRRAAAGKVVPCRGLVLRAALALRPPASAPVGVAEWLSPAERRALLSQHAPGNARIAREYLERSDGQLFEEPDPEDDGWAPYPGFSRRKAREFTKAVHARAVAEGAAEKGLDGNIAA